MAPQLGGRNGRDALDERGRIELGVLERQPEQVEPRLAGAIADPCQRPLQRAGAGGLAGREPDPIRVRRSFGPGQGRQPDQKLERRACAYFDREPR